MGYAKKRTGKDGKPRYTAVYLDLRGSERSAGTFSSEKAANQAWQKAEVEQRQGRVGDPARGRQSLRKYVERWLPSHVIEPTTREKYAYYLSAHILPVLGGLRMTSFPSTSGNGSPGCSGRAGQRGPFNTARARSSTRCWAKCA